MSGIEDRTAEVKKIADQAEMDRNWLLMSWDQRAMFTLIGEQDVPTPVHELVAMWENPEINARIRGRVGRIHAAVEQRMGVSP